MKIIDTTTFPSATIITLKRAKTLKDAIFAICETCGNIESRCGNTTWVHGDLLSYLYHAKLRGMCEGHIYKLWKRKEVNP